MGVPRDEMPMRVCARVCLCKGGVGVSQNDVVEFRLSMRGLVRWRARVNARCATRTPTHPRAPLLVVFAHLDARKPPAIDTTNLIRPLGRVF